MLNHTTAKMICVCRRICTWPDFKTFAVFKVNPVLYFCWARKVVNLNICIAKFDWGCFQKLSIAKKFVISNLKNFFIYFFFLFSVTSQTYEMLFAYEVVDQNKAKIIITKIFLPFIKNSYKICEVMKLMFKIEFIIFYRDYVKTTFFQWKIVW